MFCSAQVGKVSSNLGKVNSKGLVHFFRYIRNNNKFGLIYYDKKEDAPLYDLLIQASIQSKNQVVVFSDLIWQDWSDTGRSTVLYIVFFQGGPNYHCTHFSSPISQWSAESDHNAAWTSVMDLAHFIMLNNEVKNKDTYVVPEPEPLIILDVKSAKWMVKNDKYTKLTINISKIMNLVRNGED